MSTTKPKTTRGLADIVAGESSICTVGKGGHGLTYRGYSIEDLASKASFEEVAYLLLYNKLPTQVELDQYCKKLITLRTLPDKLKTILETIPRDTHPMDVMRTACSMLGNLEPETEFSRDSAFSQQHAIADRLLALFPGILLYWHHFHTNSKRINIELNDSSFGEYFLHLLHGRKPDPFHSQALNVSMILYAEHEFNASTFAARVTASTLSDFYSSIVSAIGTLRGPLHGGANEAAMELILRFNNSNDVEPALKKALANKEKIMGFGHRVYKKSDPRSPIIKALSRKLSHSIQDKIIFPVSETIENVMWNEKKLFPNLDFYSASAYYFLKIPVYLYTPVFVCSRITGWAAHIFEQRANNALIRPTSAYTGPDQQPFIPIEQRK